MRSMTALGPSTSSNHWWTKVCCDWKPVPTGFNASISMWPFKAMQPGNSAQRIHSGPQWGVTDRIETSAGQQGRHAACYSQFGQEDFLNRMKGPMGPPLLKTMARELPSFLAAQVTGQHPGPDQDSVQARKLDCCPGIAYHRADRQALSIMSKPEGPTSIRTFGS